MLLTESESRYIKSSVDVLLKLENVLTDVQDIESGQQGFVISGSSSFLDSYYKGLENIKRDTTFLTELSQTDSNLTEEHRALLSLIGQKMANSKYAVELRKVFGYDSAAKFVGKREGLHLMNDIRQKITFLEDRDRRVLQQSNKKRELLSQKRSWQLFSLAVIFYVILFINYRVINRDFILQQRSERILKFNASLISIISDAIITTDKEYRITNWNRYAQEMYGYTEGEVLGREVGELFKIDYHSHGISDILSANPAKTNWQGEVIHYNKSNEPIYVDVSISVIKDIEGNNIGTVSVIRNVTARHIAEERLRQLTLHLEEEVKIKVRELNAVFERITDAFIALDKNWRYTYVNKKAAELHERKPEDMIGKVIWDEFPDVVNEPFYYALLKAKEDRESKRLELYYSKSDKWFEDLIYPSADGNGMSVYYHDITKRKRAEQKLLASENDLKVSNERFTLVAKATNDAVWDWDMQADTIWGNESFCKIFDIEAGNFVNFSEFTSHLHPDDREVIEQNLKAALDNKTTYLIEEFRFKTKEGNYLTLFDRAYILYNEEGHAYRMLGAMQDITDQKIAQHQLLLEKELSDSIINSLPGIFYLYNQEGKFYRWNKNFEQVTGYTHDEIARLHPIDLFDEEEKELLRQKIANVFATGEDSIEANFLLKNKQKIPYYFRGMVINYEGENCLMGVGIDISEKVKSQKELQESEAKYRTLIEQASDGIFISNEEGDYLDVNTSATALTGYSKDELLRLNIRDILFENGLKENPLKQIEVLKGQVVINERMMKRKDHSIINVEISAKLLPDGRYQGIVRDITERKKTEEETRMSEHKYRLLFNQNPMPMSMISLPQRNFLDVNAAAVEFYGYSKQEFLNMNIRDLRPEEEVVNLTDISTYKSGINNTGIWRHRKKDGTIVKVNIITHDIINEGKHAKLVLANDITEKIIAEEKLQRSHEELRQLATHLQDIREDERTHIAREIHDELGQQLTGLKMDISWLSKKINSSNAEINQKLSESLKLIDETVKTVRRIATQLRPSILDDLGLISAMEWQSEEFEKRFSIKTMFKTNVSVVEIDSEIATGIFRIFQESLTNVLRHSKATEVNAFLKSDDTVLTLSIADNGVGFNSIQIENKKTLGLLGMKERTLMMGGTYEIASKPGNGTTVVITVPIEN